MPDACANGLKRQPATAGHGDGGTAPHPREERGPDQGGKKPAAACARALDGGQPPLAPRARETLVRLMKAHPYRKELLRHEEAVARVAASLPQMRQALDALAGESPAPEDACLAGPSGPGQAGDILAQFLEFVAFSTPEMKRLVAGEP